MTLILDLPAAVESRLSEEARREGMSLEKYALKKLAGSVSGERETGSGSGDYVLRLVKEFKESLPDGEWTGLPADLAANYKEYLRSRRGGRAE